MRGGNAGVQFGFVVGEDLVVEPQAVEGMELVGGSPSGKEAVFGVECSFYGIEAGFEDGVPIFLIIV